MRKKSLNILRIKLLFVSLITINGVYALSLGDNVNGITIKSTLDSTETMKLVTKDSKHSQYLIKSTTGQKNILINKNNQIYGFNWSEKNPNLNGMLGSNNKYSKEFANAKKNNKLIHRGLAIDTPDLHVTQYGLPGGVMEGEMIAKDLAPAQ